MIPNEKVWLALEATVDTTQKPEWHPEGNVLEHSLQCLLKAKRETVNNLLWLAALLHDIGKGMVEDHSIEDKDHAALGSEFLEAEGMPEKVVWLVSQHMRAIPYLEGEMNKFSTVVELAHHPWFPQLIWLYRWDHMSRSPTANVSRLYNRERLEEALSTPFHGFSQLEEIRSG
jgi:putative nucleotidyltransferase with HDIG domain